MAASTFRGSFASTFTNTSYLPMTPLTSVTSGRDFIFAITSFSFPGIHVAKMYAIMLFRNWMLLNNLSKLEKRSLLRQSYYDHNTHCQNTCRNSSKFRDNRGSYYGDLLCSL